MIDEGWFLKNPQDRPTPEKLDANVRSIPVPSCFPSAIDHDENTGFVALGAFVYARGMKFGIHIVRGIPHESVTRNLPVAESRFTAKAAATAAAKFGRKRRTAAPNQSPSPFRTTASLSLK